MNKRTLGLLVVYLGLIGCESQVTFTYRSDAAVGGNDTNGDASLDAGSLDANAEASSLTCNNNTQHICDGLCVSLASPLGCGPSCARCDAIPGGEPRCDNNACTIVCAPSTPDRCSNACVNLENDSGNCGTCGNACPSNQLCLNRSCQAPPQCTMAQDSACAGMSYCNLTTRRCAAGCDGRSDQCSAGMVCDAERHTCGCDAPNRMCGNICATCPMLTHATGYACDGNACILRGCDPGYQRTQNNTQCTDINECDSNNGGCGAATCMNTEGGRTCSCQSPNRECGGACALCPSDANQLTTTCNMNACVIASCAPGFAPSSNGTVCEARRFSLSQALSIGARPMGSEYFATSVALSPDGLELAVGDYNFGTGRSGGVHLYRRTSVGTPFAAAPTRTLTGSNESENFGVSLAYTSDGLELAVGDSFFGAAQLGAVHIYRRQSVSGTFANTPNQTLIGPTGSRIFGSSIAYTNDSLELAVGDGVFGSVNIYRRASVATPFANDPTLTLTRPSPSLSFGDSLAYMNDGLELAVADRGYSRVHFYRRASVSAPFASSPTQTLTGPLGSRSFGASVACPQDGLELAVGALGLGDDYRGSVQIYRRPRIDAQFAYDPSETLLGPTGNRSEFGTALSYENDGSALFVGAFLSTAGTGPGQGTAWAFVR